MDHEEKVVANCVFLRKAVRDCLKHLDGEVGSPV